MMISNGAKVDGDQKILIVDYLAAKSVFDVKCSVCHPVDRPLSKSKSPAEWHATVRRMSGKKPGHLTDADLDAIASWLSVNRPPASAP